MEEGTKAFVKEVKALPKAVRDEDCFKVPLHPAYSSSPCLAYTPVHNKLWHCCLGLIFLLQYQVVSMSNVARWLLASSDNQAKLARAALSVVYLSRRDADYLAQLSKVCFLEF
jgi:hypothetical protein